METIVASLLCRSLGIVKCLFKLLYYLFFFFSLLYKYIFFSHDKTHFHKKRFALIFGLVLKVRVIGTRKWNTSFTKTFQDIWVKLKSSFCVRQKMTVL